MTTTVNSIIDFLLARAADAPLAPAELQAFTGELKARIDQLSVSVPDATPDAVTVLYSGLLPGGQPTRTVAENLVAVGPPGEVLTISQTEIGTLLDIENTDFHEALRAALGNDVEDYNNLLDGKDLSGNRISSDSLWDDASRRFVANTTGAVRVVSTDGLADSVFAQSELPELFNNTAITEIDGIPRDQYLSLLERKGVEAVREVIFTNARVQVELADLAGGNLQRYFELAPGENFNNYFELYEDQDTRSRLLRYFAELEPERLANLKTVTASAVEVGEELVSGGLAGGANRLGMLGTVAGFMLASYSSSVAAEAGDQDRAKDIMAEWAADAAGSAAGEAVGGTLGAAAVAIIAAAGVTLSAPLTGAIVFGAALIGGIFGAEGAVGIYELTRGKDRDGKLDLFKAMTDLLYGDDFTITDAPLPGFEGARITLDTTFSRGEIIENAKSSIAWRYALRHLNPFVIEGDAALYAGHNRNNELDPENFSEQYLEDRAEMLLWRLRYDKAGKRYTDEWNSWELTGDWDFIDRSIRVDAQSLKFSIDGWNGFTPAAAPSHQVVFGSSDSETLTGGTESDFLYGGAGDDTLTGHAGDDYLEGGKGADSYLYNTGDGLDTIFDEDGSGRILYDGAALSGEKNSIGDGLYTDAENRLYRFNDSGDGTGSLLINNTILIRRFDSNAENFLGISLAGNRIDDAIAADTAISGTSGDDTGSALDGGNGSDHIEGLGGNDRARGFIGADLIEGGAGDDILEGGPGDDVLHGGVAGDVDQIVDSSGQQAGTTHDWLSGDEGDDQLYGSGGADVLAGGSGGDIVWGGAGDDLIQGDSERKPANHAWVDAWINDNDLQSSGELNPAGSGNDILLGGAGNDRIWGQAGDDVINGGSGNDLISGDLTGLSAQGERLLSGEFHGNDAINGDQGDDLMEGGGGDDMLFGGDDNDQLYGDAKSVLMPDGQTLLLRVEYHGRDTLFGDDGDDLLVGGGEADNLAGGEGADVLYGDDETSGIDLQSHGDDTLRGGAGNDRLLGNGGSDQLYGEGGDDAVWGGAGGDFLSGGAGSDYLVGDDNTDAAASDGEDTIFGGTGNDILYGSGGGDRLDGGSGDDELYGGEGGDTLAGGSGNDYLNGGEGADSYLFHNGDGIDAVDGDANDQVNLPVSAEVSTTVATGTDGTDYLAIQYSANDWVLIEGGLETAVDRYVTGNGEIHDKNELLNATLTSGIEYRMQAAGEVSGGRFDDTLVGSFESDTLRGQDGNDTLVGGAGDDHLLGGAGLDVYRIGWGTGRDRISEQPDSESRLELLPGLEIADLDYERQGDNLFIRIRDGRDGVLLENYYNLEQSWRIADRQGEMVLNHANEPSATNAAIADSAAALWHDFRQQTENAYGGLLRLRGYEESAAGGFERSYAGGATDQRWKNRYNVTLSLRTVEGVSGEYQRQLAEMETTVTGFRQAVSVQEQFHLAGSNATYVGAGRSGANYLPAAGSYSGISIQPDDLLVADYGLDRWRNPLTGELVQEIRGYYLYPSGSTVPGNIPVFRLYTETDYRVEVNIAEIIAGDTDDSISTGATHFNLVDGGGGNDLIDASRVGDGVPVPGREAVTGIRLPGTLLFGNDGDDLLYGGAWDDVLIGGQGSDLLLGDSGDDTYYLFDAAGGDRIVEWGEERAGASGDDTLVLPAGVGFEELVFTWGESVETDDFIDPAKHGRRVDVPVESMHTTLQLSWADSARVTLVLPHSDKGAGFGMDRVVTAAGESRAFTALIEDAGPGPGQDPHFQNNIFSGKGILNGAAGDDWLVAEPYAEDPRQLSGTSVLIGGAGADRLEGQAGRNILIGGLPLAAGADGLPYSLKFSGTFWGDPGNVFSGGEGGDEIWTTAGSDTILFSLGDGADTIESARAASGADQLAELRNGHDTLKFGIGIAPADISLFVEDENLVFSHVNNADRLDFRHWFGNQVNQLDRVEFHNGVVWDQADILALAAGDQLGDPPLLQTPLEDREVVGSVPFSVTIPEATFSHADGAITYSVELQDGSALPDWIRFDDEKLLLSGIPDSAEAGDWNIRVVASTEFGPSAYDLFTLSVNNVAGLILTGGESDDILTGSDEADVIVGAGGSNSLEGRGGDDWFPVVGIQQGINSYNGGDGTDRIQGSAGDDLIRVTNFFGDNRVEIVAGGEGTDTLSGDHTDNRIDLHATRLIGVERIHGQAGNDTIVGSIGDDRIHGDSGDDLLRGGAGDDWLGGGIGNDILKGGSGRDTLNGGGGDDDLSGGAGNDKISGGPGDDLLHGNAGDDSLAGGDGNDRIYGSAGDDFIRGGSGGDSLYGGLGNDRIRGGKGRDTLYGAAGDDTLDGGAGADILYAGEGSDTLVFGRGYGHDHAVPGNRAENLPDQFADRVIFKTGISVDQLWFEARSADLDISIIGTADRLTIVDWYANSNNRPETFVTSDGSMLARDGVDRLVNAMAGFNPPAMGETQLPEALKAELEPVIAVGWQ